MGDDVAHPGRSAGTAADRTAGPLRRSANNPRFCPQWLQLRERADDAARAPELLRPLRDHLAAAPAPERFGGTDGLVIRDLGCGTAAMGRWLAVRLPGPQHWVLQDHDPVLLAHAALRMPSTAADGRPVTAVTAYGDIAGLTAATLADTSLVTASALLDLLTRDELEAVAAACTGAGCPALLVLSVNGRVELAPPDPLDAAVCAAFNAHQRRAAGGGRLLGPDAVAAAAEAFARRGARVITWPSPWRLGGPESALTERWLRGWVAAAREQRPELAAEADGYLRRRLESCAAGELAVAVHHTDLLALPMRLA